jgi:hypothetical protein
MTNAEKENFLLAKGWTQDDRTAPWVWLHPGLPACFYILADAWDLAKAEEREKRERG